MLYDITRRLEYQLEDSVDQKSPVKRTFKPFLFENIPLTVQVYAHVGTHKIDYPRPMPKAEINVTTLYTCPIKDFSAFEVRFKIADDEEKEFSQLLQGFHNCVFMDRDKLVQLFDICYRVDEYRKENPNWRQDIKQDEDEEEFFIEEEEQEQVC